MIDVQHGSDDLGESIGDVAEYVPYSILRHKLAIGDLHALVLKLHSAVLYYIDWLIHSKVLLVVFHQNVEDL